MVWRSIQFWLIIVVCAANLASAQSRDGFEALMRLLERSSDAVRADLLAGMLKGLEGRRSVDMPLRWKAAYSRLQRSNSLLVRESALKLALVFDDPHALEVLRQRASDPLAAAESRNEAIQRLVAKKPTGLAPLLLRLALEPATAGSAVRGLAEYDHPATAAILLDHYTDFDAATRRDAIQTLASRRSWAQSLLTAVASDRIPLADLTAYTARQLRNLGSPEITQRVRLIWGEVRSTAEDKAELMRTYRQRLTAESLQRGNRSAGRAIYQKTCANCHRLFDDGGSIGPDITGAQRTNLDYLLENLIDPNATVAKAYQMQVLQTGDGRIITGLVVAENRQAVTIQTVNQRLVVPVDEIEQRRTSPLSMMPEGLLEKLALRQVRDLVAYLRSPTQVALEQFERSQGK